jgi:hypothetical protein
MECDTGGAVASEEVAQIRADPLPDLVAVGSGIVLQPDGEGVPCGLHLIVVYARGFFKPGWLSPWAAVRRRHRPSREAARSHRCVPPSGLPHSHGCFETTTLSSSW